MTQSDRPGDGEGAPRSLKEAEDHSWVDHAARFGLVAYGVVHLLVAYLALQLALGSPSGSASGSGALHELAQQPYGLVGLWLVALGMLLLVSWRLLEAAVGRREETDPGKRTRKRLGSLLKAVLYGSLGVAAVQVAVGGGSSSGGGTDSTTATLLQLPGGQLIVGAVGLAILGYAVQQIRTAWTEGFREHITAQGESGGSGTAYVWLGKAGYTAKGVAVGVVGVLFGYAAVTHDAARSGGLDQALEQIREQPFGRVLLGIVALGIGCYGVFCFARARHLSR